MTALIIAARYARYLLSSLASIAFGLHLNQKDFPVTALRIAGTYARYLLSSLASIAFGLGLNQGVAVVAIRPVSRQTRVLPGVPVPAAIDPDDT